jgi:hypothetical protein
MGFFHLTFVVKFTSQVLLVLATGRPPVVDSRVGRLSQETGAPGRGRVLSLRRRLLHLLSVSPCRT